MRFKNPTLALFLCVAILEALMISRFGLPHSSQIDFAAFYCGGDAVRHGSNPYLTEPIRTCEMAAVPGFFPPKNRLAIPAPLPGYAFLPFMILSTVPFWAANIIWVLFITGAYFVLVRSLHRLTGLPILMIFFATLMSVFYLSLLLGQPVVIAIAFLVLSAEYLEKHRPRLASFMAMGTLIEPHLALPLIFALFLFNQAGRIALMLGLAVTALASIIVLGVDLNYQYVALVMPAQIMSELHNEQQYSASFLAIVFGSNDSIAKTVGDVSYVADLIVGLVVSFFLMKKYQSPALALTVPVAFSVLGGPYLHAQHLGAAAMPAALLIFQKTRSTSKRSIGIAILLLSIPWGSSLMLMYALPILMLVTAYLAYTYLKKPLLISAGIGSLSALVILCANSVYVSQPMISFEGWPTNDGSFPVQMTWQHLRDVSFHGNITLLVILHSITWTGLILLYVTIIKHIVTLKFEKDAYLDLFRKRKMIQ